MTREESDWPPTIGYTKINYCLKAQLIVLFEAQVQCFLSRDPEDQGSTNSVPFAACLHVGKVVQAKAAALDGDAVVNSELVGELRSVHMPCQAASMLFVKL